MRSPGPIPTRAPGRTPADDAKSVATFGHLEDEAMSWIAAADPRLAARASSPAPATDDVLKRIGTEAVLAEDATAVIHGGSLDLFAFRARARALDEAAHRVAAFGDPLPDGAAPDGAIARPRLERELLARVIQEEEVRAAEEAKLGDASGDLVRAIVATWTPPAAPEEWPLRDAWVSKHLLEIRDSLRQGPPRTGPLDLDVELYPLERLLAPLQFPRGSAAIAELRMGLDADMRAVPSLVTPERVAFGAKVHLGVAVDARDAGGAVRAHRGAASRASRRPRSRRAAPGRGAIEARARQLLLVERPCPAVPGTRVRSMGPPPERAAICGILRALMEEPAQAAALVALHDDVAPRRRRRHGQPSAAHGPALAPRGRPGRRPAPRGARAAGAGDRRRPRGGAPLRDARFGRAPPRVARARRSAARRRHARDQRRPLRRARARGDRESVGPDSRLLLSPPVLFLLARVGRAGVGAPTGTSCSRRSPSPT